MNILITGNTGYVGSRLVPFLRSSDTSINIIGYDIGYFAKQLTGTKVPPEAALTEQIFGDIRCLNSELFHGIDAVVHLAAISNDPMGQEFSSVTKLINEDAAVATAKMAAESGVKNFVFASSCSVYGTAGKEPRKEDDRTDPLTAYAKSKIGVETALENADLGDMVFTSLRFSTACGMSDRMRLDLVLNDFVASAFLFNRIDILSDGTPWRPLIDVEDMSRAIYWAIMRKTENGGRKLIVNCGSDSNNIQIKDLAQLVLEKFPNSELSINEEAQPDKRSYKVDFSKFKNLAPKFQPKISLEESIHKILKGLEAMEFTDRNFRNSDLIRLNVLRSHMNNGKLSQDLRWCK